MQFTFDAALISLWRIWNGDSEKIEAENHIVLLDRSYRVPGLINDHAGVNELIGDTIVV